MTENSSPSADSTPGVEPRYQGLRGVEYERVNGFARDKMSLTAREWGIARLCADFRTPTGIEMAKAGSAAPDVVPWFEDELSRSNVGATRARVKAKALRGLTTALWAIYSGAFDADEIDDLQYRATETALFLCEVEGASVPVDREQRADEVLEDALADRLDRASQDAHGEL